MDENLQELENELKRLTPRAPSAALRQALDRELDAPAPDVSRHGPREASARAWRWAAWALGGVAAAAAAFVVLVDSRRAAPATETFEVSEPATTVADVATSVTATEAPEPAVAPAGRYEPVHASTVLYALQEGAPTVLPDHSEGREVRYRYVDTYTWRNPATNASLRWSVPRDEVRIVRTNFN